MNSMDLNTSDSLSPTQATSPQQVDAAAEEEVLPESSLKVSTTSHHSSSGGAKRNSSSSSGSSVRSFESEEGFVSGEDEFEAALERPVIVDASEETLELAMEGEKIAPVVETIVGSSNLLSPENDDGDAVANENLVREVEDDGGSGVIRVPSIGEFEKPNSMVEAPKEGDGSSAVSGTVGDGVPEATDIATTGYKTTEDSSLLEKSSLVGKNENRAFSSEGQEPWAENNLVLDSVSVGLEGHSAPSLIPSVVTTMGSKDNILPDNPKLGEVVNHEVGRQVKAVTELKDGVAEEKKSEILSADNNVSLNSTNELDSVVDTKQAIEVEENGVSDVKEVELPDEKCANLDGGNYQANPVTEDKFVEADIDVNPRKEGDSVVETKQPISLEFDADVVGDIEENGVSETKNLELADQRSVNLGIVSDQAASAVEPVDPKLVEADNSAGKNLEPVTNSVVETLKPEMEESKTDLAEMEKDEAAKNDGSVSLDPDNNSDKPELESELKTESGAKLNEPVFKIAANGYESGPAGKVDIPYETGIADPYTKSAELNLMEEKSHALINEESKHLENNGDFASSQGDVLGDAVTSTSHTSESVVQSSALDREVKWAEDALNPHSDYEEENEGSVSGEDTEGLIFDGAEATEQIMKELVQGSGFNSHSGGESSQDRSKTIDGQIVMDSDEDADTDEEGDGKELFDSAALAALLKAATSAGSEGGSVTITAPDGSRLFSVERPAGLGSSIRSLKPAPRSNRLDHFPPSGRVIEGELDNNLSEEEKKKLEKIQVIRVKFLRLIHRLGLSPEDSVAAQVLYRLVLAAGRRTGEAFTLESAKRTAMQLEAEGKDDLDFSLNILVLGKTGVGKSATINSIFGEEKALIDAFEPATSAVKEIVGTVGGIKIRVFDTPGLRSSAMEQAFNRKILSSVKKFTKKCPPDILLYVDRLDAQTRDLNDLPLLRSVSTTLGSSIWRNAIVTLTHAASAPPDGPSGSPLSYEVFVAQRSHIVQQSIGQAVGDLRMMNPSLMNPVSLVENHPSCRRNREGQRVLPNGQTWRPQLLLLCYSIKILSEVSSLSKPQDPFDHRKLFGFRGRSPPLPYLLSTLLQSRTHPKLPSDQGGENVDSDIDLDDFSDSDKEEEDEYDQLPPFKPLRKSQIAKLSKEQRKAYFDEYDYRVKLLQKKQLREELKRMREMKKKGKDGADDYGYMGMGEEADQENGGPAAVPVPLPDMVLPPSFDGDNPTYRFRFLEPTSQLLARPVLDTHGWDHDCGYDGVSLEENLAIAGRFPAGVAVQITKDKKEFNIHLDSSVAAKHGENGSTLAGFDIQTIGKQLAYIVRGETKFKNLKKNKTAGGLSITFLGENVATGLKIEDQISIGKCLTLVGSTGTVRSQGDVAYGANLEARLKEKDYPIGQNQSTLGLSLMRWRGDLALGANLQSQFSIGRSSKMSVRVGLNNKLSGQITVRTSSSDQLQIALVGILPIAIAIYRSIWPGASESYFAY